jgi:uncharacterized NAD(P)/FAD-binding protein YdhS
MSDVAHDAKDALMGTLHRNSLTGTKAIAIVGGGYSGLMAAVHLMRALNKSDATIYLIDKQARVGRGLAYSIWDDSMLLNVPAGNMSAFPDSPTDFLEYCRALDPSLNAGSFVPRRIYGDYLEKVLALESSRSSVSFTCLHREAVAIRTHEHAAGFRITFADASQLLADEVVLAFGYQGAQPMALGIPLLETGKYIENPWNYRAMDAVSSGQPVAIIGSGHTAIDALFRLTGLDEGRTVFMLSRHGLVPKSHRPVSQPPTQGDFPAYLTGIPNTARAYMRAVRKEVKRREQLGQDWRDVLNEIRPHTKKIWLLWPSFERKRFLRSIRPWWDIHRHRLAPSAAARLKSKIDSGSLKVLAGRMIDIEQLAAGLKLTYRQRTTGEIKKFKVDTVVNCTGPDYDIDRINSPLITQLREEGYIVADPLRLGLEIDETYSVIGREGKITPGLRYLGPMLRARYWEAIAVPELRGHAKQVAAEILNPSSRDQP